MEQLICFESGQENIVEFIHAVLQEVIEAEGWIVDALVVVVVVQEARQVLVVVPAQVFVDCWLVNYDIFELLEPANLIDYDQRHHGHGRLDLRGLSTLRHVFLGLHFRVKHQVLQRRLIGEKCVLKTFDVVARGHLRLGVLTA